MARGLWNNRIGTIVWETWVMIVKMKATMITISGIEIDNEDEMRGKSKVETAAHLLWNLTPLIYLTESDSFICKQEWTMFSLVKDGQYYARLLGIGCTPNICCNSLVLLNSQHKAEGRICRRQGRQSVHSGYSEKDVYVPWKRLGLT